MSDSYDYTPKYIQIKNFIINKIESGDFTFGDKIPSEIELSNIFNVSRITVNSAIKELVAEGIIDRIQGKGSFVKNLNSKNTNTSMAFLNNIKLSEIYNDTKKHKFIKKNIMEPDEKLKNKFKLKDNEFIYEIVRLMYENDIPNSIDYSYIPMKLLDNHDIDINVLENNYIHHYLKGNLNKNPKYINIYINTKVLSNFELSLLNAKDSDSFTIWDTDVLDENKWVISSTTTLTKSNCNKPFLTFEI